MNRLLSILAAILVLLAIWWLAWTPYPPRPPVVQPTKAEKVIIRQWLVKHGDIQPVCVLEKCFFERNGERIRL